MRKVLLMLSLTMLGTMLFASAAFAEHTARHVRAGSNGGWTPPPSVNPTTGCPHMWVPLPSGECVPVSDPRLDTPSPSPTATPTASPSPTASATASATAAADSQYSAPSLPSTGGVSPILALGSLALLATGGLFAAGLARRG